MYGKINVSVLNILCGTIVMMMVIMMMTFLTVIYVIVYVCETERSGLPFRQLYEFLPCASCLLRPLWLSIDAASLCLPEAANNPSGSVCVVGAPAMQEKLETDGGSS